MSEIGPFKCFARYKIYALSAVVHLVPATEAGRVGMVNMATFSVLALPIRSAMGVNRSTAIATCTCCQACCAELAARLTGQLVTLSSVSVGLQKQLGLH